MGRLVFIVEGDCELRFVERKIIPYLYAVVQEGHEVHICAQKITTNRRLNRSGGNVGFAYLKNEVGRVAKQGEPWVTTFLDFFRLPPDYPGYSLDSSKIDQVEVGVKAEVSTNGSFHIFKDMSLRLCCLLQQMALTHFCRSRRRWTLSRFHLVIRMLKT